MAVKKTTKKKDESAAPTKAEAKETAPKKKSAKAKEAASAPAPEPAPAPAPVEEPAPTPKASAPKGGAKKAAAAPIKLSSSQQDLLKKIGEAPEPGYTLGKKIEQRSIDGLLEKKLIKKGAKDKESGNVRYLISSAGKKHIGA